MKIMVSACLTGENCKYNGGNNLSEKILQLTEGNEVITVCPEILGGLPTPRVPAEIKDGVVTAKDGRIVDAQFRAGAAKCLEIALREQPELIVLQSRSPSCGVKQRYDGTFTGKLVNGSGVTAQLLMAKGFRCVDVEDLEETGETGAGSLSPHSTKKETETRPLSPLLTYGNPDADTLLFQMVDDHDLAVIENEVSLIRELTGGQDFCLKVVKVKNWNQDLAPWRAPAVFGNEDFGEGAAETLEYLLKEVVPDPSAGEAPHVKRMYLGGYSLAGLFALWAGCRTDRFAGIAAASPSVWFPHFTEYLRDDPMQADRVYLSLGDREERTRNPVMSQVGNAIREAAAILKDAGKDCVLEWNKGNHFKEPDLRTAKAFAWLMNQDPETDRTEGVD